MFVTKYIQKCISLAIHTCTSKWSNTHTHDHINERTCTFVSLLTLKTHEYRTSTILRRSAVFYAFFLFGHGASQSFTMCKCLSMVLPYVYMYVENGIYFKSWHVGIISAVCKPQSLLCAYQMAWDGLLSSFIVICLLATWKDMLYIQASADCLEVNNLLSTFGKQPCNRNLTILSTFPNSNNSCLSLSLSLFRNGVNWLLMVVIGNTLICLIFKLI